MKIGIQIAKDYDLFRVVAPDGTGSEPQEVGFLAVVTDRAGVTYGAVVEDVDDRTPKVYRLAQAECQIEQVAEFRHKDGTVFCLEDDEEEDGEEEDEEGEDGEDDIELSTDAEDADDELEEGEEGEESEGEESEDDGEDGDGDPENE